MDNLKDLEELIQLDALELDEVMMSVYGLRELKAS